MKRTKSRFGLLALALPAFAGLGSSGRPVEECVQQTELTPLASTESATITCMMVWPTETTEFWEGEGPEGCLYQLAYCYELVDGAEETLSLMTDSVDHALAGPESPFVTESSMGCGLKGFFWLEDGDPEKLAAGAVATFELGPQPLLEWRVAPE